jgi:hypothetical protein
MSSTVENLKALFTGKETGAVRTQRELSEKQAAEARQQQEAALNHQQQQLQVEQAMRDEQVGAASRLPRGRRLLLAATGERGVQRTLG